MQRLLPGFGLGSAVSSPVRVGHALVQTIRDPEVLECVRSALESRLVCERRSTTLVSGKIFEVNASPMPAGGAVAVLHDITRIEEVERTQRDFVANVSHELRTPLTSISGYVELLLEEEHDPERHGHLKVVERNTGRLLGLVSDLLFAARLQSGGFEVKRSPVDIGVIVQQAAAAARPHAEAASVALRVRGDDAAMVDGEEDRLAQLLDNLISNAIKFTPAGGEVAVTLAAQNRQVSIEVSDTGIGIREEDLSRLFMRFFRSDATAAAAIPGTGLGLFIAKGIVEAHGGQIVVRSSVGKGTTFVVDLPAAIG
jgi:two-component system phosphate regulon sensor histidine kinase PhoR